MTLYVQGPTLSDDEVRGMVEDVFRSMFPDGVQPTVTVSSRDDFDGDPALYVLALFSHGAPIPRGNEGSALRLALSDALIARRELRFPHLRMLRQSDLEDLASEPDGLTDG